MNFEIRHKRTYCPPSLLEKKHCISTPGRWQSKTLLTVDECGSKFARNSVFDCNRKLCFWQIFKLRSSIVSTFSIAACPVWSGQGPNAWYFRPKMAAKSGKRHGYSVDPALEYIGNRTKMDCSECSILRPLNEQTLTTGAFFKASCRYLYIL